MMDGGGFVDQYDRDDDRYQRPRFANGGDVDDSYRHRDSSTGKLFVGGIAWETTRERFTDYFCKYGEVTDAIIMMDKFTGKPRGFGFVTFADPSVADKVLQEDHVIDGRAIEVKRTVPREEMPGKGAPPRTRKLFVGGLIPTFTEDELKEYFSSFGNVVEHQIMFDHETGRSRSFGFVTFENEEAVERILTDGRVHELGGRPVEIKRALPKRFGGEYGNDHGGVGSVSKPYGGYKGGANEYQGGYSGGKMGRGYDEYGNYGAYAGNYGGGAAAAGFYGGYGGYGGGYGYGFWGPMYGGGGGVYGGNMYGGYGGGGGGYGGGGGGFGGGKGYGGGSKGYGAGGSASGRYHPYQK